MTIYLIRSLDERDDDDNPLWWSNENGWVSITNGALVYAEQEFRLVNLPIAGEWVKFISS